MFSPSDPRRARSTSSPSARRSRQGTAEVDAAFLAEIEAWRDVLARNIALRNPDSRQRDLNFAVQRTIDRIIFLRICEDRGIEPYGSCKRCATARASTAASARCSTGPTSATTPACSTFTPRTTAPSRPTS